MQSIEKFLEDYAKSVGFYKFTHTFSNCIEEDNDIAEVEKLIKNLIYEYSRNLIDYIDNNPIDWADYEAKMPRLDKLKDEMLCNT